MSPLSLDNPIYHDEDAARNHLEALRWPNGVICPLCGVTEQASPVRGNSMGAGWYYCSACQGKFTVRVGTVYERSHVALHKWVLAFRLMCGSKKGISAHQLHRTIGVTYKTAWFMEHRIRKAMENTDPTPLGGKDKVIEADETFHGPAKNYVFVNGKGWMKKQGATSKRDAVVTLVERGGKARSFSVKDVNLKNVREVLEAHADMASELNTDQAPVYKSLGKQFAKHEAVNHSAKEYGRGSVTTNTVEGFFSIFKRGMTGVYQHCSDRHLPRYLAEFDFRYSNRAALEVDDMMRTDRAIKGAEGKRLTYRRLNRRSAGAV